MIFNTDLSRLRELRYRDISIQEESPDMSFIGFLKQSLTLYYSKYLRNEKNGILRRAHTRSGNNIIEFSIFGDNKIPLPQRVRVSGSINNLSILDKFCCDITIRFSDFKIDQIPEPSNSRIRENMIGNISPVGPLSLFFTNGVMLKKMIFRPKEKTKKDICDYKKFYKNQVSMKEFLTTSDRILIEQTLYNSLPYTERVYIRDSFYAGGDQNNSLINEGCDIYKSNTGFHMDYSISSPIESKEMELEALDRATIFFNALSDNFNLGMLKCLKVE